MTPDLTPLLFFSLLAVNRCLLSPFLVSNMSLDFMVRYLLDRFDRNYNGSEFPRRCLEVTTSAVFIKGPSKQQTCQCMRGKNRMERPSLHLMGEDCSSSSSLFDAKQPSNRPTFCFSARNSGQAINAGSKSPRLAAAKRICRSTTRSLFRIPNISHRSQMGVHPLFAKKTSRHGAMISVFFFSFFSLSFFRISVSFWFSRQAIAIRGVDRLDHYPKRLGSSFMQNPKTEAAKNSAIKPPAAAGSRIFFSR